MVNRNPLEVHVAKDRIIHLPKSPMLEAKAWEDVTLPDLFAPIEFEICTVERPYDRAYVYHRCDQHNVVFHWLKEE